MTTALDQLTDKLTRLSTHFDMLGEWPEASLQHLTDAGAWAWIIPEPYGGLELDPISQLLVYEAIGAGCMATLLILTQRDGACELIALADNDALKNELLPRLARNDLMTSVGISQLTTSNQTGKPALTAEPVGDEFRLKGFMPWVTGAEKCDFVVTGAVLPDDRQILAVVPLDLPGVQVDPAMKLMALESSCTSEVYCRDVLLKRDLILVGPAEKALARRSTVKPLVVAASGIGLAQSMIQLIVKQAVGTDGPLKEMAEELAARYEAVRERLFKVAEQLNDPNAEVPTTEVRVAVNDLLLRLAIGSLTYAKGSGFIRQRNAQRLVREAMFFLVWSAPDNVRARTLAGFLNTPEPESRSMSH